VWTSGRIRTFLCVSRFKLKNFLYKDLKFRTKNRKFNIKAIELSNKTFVICLITSSRWNFSELIMW
jgi:hypothetical protein